MKADGRPLGEYTWNLARQGFFVSFEGIDGSGKTTQIGMLAARLRALGVAPVLAQEPGGTRVGRLIRAILLDSSNSGLHATTELLLYFASRVQNLTEVIHPALKEGRLVISDRFTDATVAYQGYGRALGEERVLQLSEFACEGLEPDLTLWLDIETSTAVARAQERNRDQLVDEGLMESQSKRFFSRVRQGYAAIHKANPVRVRRIDARGNPAEVARRIFDAVQPELRDRGFEGF